MGNPTYLEHSNHTFIPNRQRETGRKLTTDQASTTWQVLYYVSYRQASAFPHIAPVSYVLSFVFQIWNWGSREAKYLAQDHWPMGSQNWVTAWLILKPSSSQGTGYKCKYRNLQAANVRKMWACIRVSISWASSCVWCTLCVRTSSASGCASAHFSVQSTAVQDLYLKPRMSAELGKKTAVM